MLNSEHGGESVDASNYSSPSRGVPESEVIPPGKNKLIDMVRKYHPQGTKIGAVKIVTALDDSTSFKVLLLQFKKICGMK